MRVSIEQQHDKHVICMYNIMLYEWMNVWIHPSIIYCFIPQQGFRDPEPSPAAFRWAVGVHPPPSHQYTTIHTHIHLSGHFGIPDWVPPDTRPWSLGGSRRTPREPAQMQREQEDSTQKWGRWLAAVVSNSANTAPACLFMSYLYQCSAHLPTWNVLTESKCRNKIYI